MEQNERKWRGRCFATLALQLEVEITVMTTSSGWRPSAPPTAIVMHALCDDLLSHNTTSSVDANAEARLIARSVSYFPVAPG